HPDEFRALPAKYWDQEVRCVCPSCPKSYESARALRQHMRVHDRVHPYKNGKNRKKAQDRLKSPKPAQFSTGDSTNLAPSTDTKPEHFDHLAKCAIKYVLNRDPSPVAEETDFGSGA
ncbi:MAG: hypothetical protein M1812_000338, partial [Candelaria pacifica]